MAKRFPVSVPPGVEIGAHKFAIEWDVPEERVSGRTGRTYTVSVRNGYSHRSLKLVEKKKAELEAEGFNVTDIYDAWSMKI